MTEPSITVEVDSVTTLPPVAVPGTPGLCRFCHVEHETRSCSRVQDYIASRILGRVKQFCHVDPLPSSKKHIIRHIFTIRGVSSFSSTYEQNFSRPGVSLGSLHTTLIVTLHYTIKKLCIMNFQYMPNAKTVVPCIDNKVTTQIKFVGLS